MKIIISIMLLFIGNFAFGQAPSATPAAVSSPSPAAPVAVAAPSATPAPSIIQKAQALEDKIPSTIPAWVLAVIAFLVEISMRFWPTVQPRSLFILAGQAFGVIGMGFTKISGLLDLIVQNIKDPSQGQG